MYAALRLLAFDRHAIVRWIDTEGSFSAARARSILELLGYKVSFPWTKCHSRQADRQSVESILGRLVVTPCFTLDPDMFEVIAGIKEESDRSDQVDCLTRLSLLMLTRLGGRT
jgi:DNA repair protein RAD51